MKKYFFLFVFLLPFCFCFAQNEPDKVNKWEIGLQINTPERMIPYFEEQDAPGWVDGYLYYGMGLNATTKNRSFAISALGNYNFKGDDFFRIKTGFTRVDIVLTDNEPDPSGGTTVIHENAWKKRSDMIIAPGIGRRLQIKQMSFYAGLDLPFTYYGQARVYDFVQVNDYSTGALLESNEISGTIFKAFSLGVGNFAGLTVDFKSMSLGGELSYALLYSRRISESTFSDVWRNYQTNVVTISTVSTNPKMTNFEMSKIKASIIFIYPF